MDEIFTWIDQNQEAQIKLLAESVACPSVSAWLPTHRDHILKNIECYSTRLRSLGFITEKRDVGTATLEGTPEAIPPVLLAVLEKEDPKKRTLLVYGHLDVQPAVETDGWDSNPWELTVRDSKLYGRGSTDDKGPVLAWTNAIEAYQKTGQDLPVNIRFLLESMEESGSLGLEECLETMKKNQDKFLEGVDFCVISDSYWLGDNKPCLAYGLRGIAQFLVEIRCGKSDLHSGSCGSLVQEAMSDLVWVLNQLVNQDCSIQIPGINDEVKPSSDEELKTYSNINFDMEKKEEEIGNKFIHRNNPVRVLQGIWRLPCLSIHGIEGAFSDKGFKTVIPCKVIGKFSIRTVPNMTKHKTRETVLNYLNDLWKTRNSNNRATFTCSDQGSWYFVEPSSPNYTAARNAVQTVYGCEPDLIREGGSIPITITIAKCTGKDVCLLPIGCSNDGAHSQNEKINITNYINGCKVMASYMDQLASVKVD